MNSLSVLSVVKENEAWRLQISLTHWMHLFFCEWRLVNRRVGGLEDKFMDTMSADPVNRRVGGLEEIPFNPSLSLIS